MICCTVLALLQHSRELHEQEEMLEEIYQDRLDLLHKSIKKQRTR